MLFGEKYGTDVRTIMVRIMTAADLRKHGVWNLRRHPRASTGKIGLFKITSQSSVSAGSAALNVAGAAAIEAVVNWKRRFRLWRILESGPPGRATRIEKISSERRFWKRNFSSISPGAADQYETIAKTVSAVSVSSDQSLSGRSRDKQLREIADRLKEDKRADCCLSHRQ